MKQLTFNRLARAICVFSIGLITVLALFFSVFAYPRSFSYSGFFFIGSNVGLGIDGGVAFLFWLIGFFDFWMFACGILIMMAGAKILFAKEEQKPQTALEKICSFFNVQSKLHEMIYVLVGASFCFLYLLWGIICVLVFDNSYTVSYIPFILCALVLAAYFVCAERVSDRPIKENKSEQEQPAFEQPEYDPAFEQEQQPEYPAYSPEELADVQDRLQSYKAMLDNKLISQEEYDQVKRQLLGL